MERLLPLQGMAQMAASRNLMIRSWHELLCTLYRLANLMRLPWRELHTRIQMNIATHQKNKEEKQKYRVKGETENCTNCGNATTL